MKKNNKNTQTASNIAKLAGFKTLKEVAELCGVTAVTLNNYFNSDHEKYYDALHTASRKKIEHVKKCNN